MGERGTWDLGGVLTLNSENKEAWKTLSFRMLLWRTTPLTGVERNRTPYCTVEQTFSTSYTTWTKIYLFQTIFLVYWLTLLCRKNRSTGEPLYRSPVFMSPWIGVFYVLNMLCNLSECGPFHMCKAKSFHSLATREHSLRYIHPKPQVGHLHGTGKRCPLPSPSSCWQRWHSTPALDFHSTVWPRTNTTCWTKGSESKSGSSLVSCLMFLFTSQCQWADKFSGGFSRFNEPEPQGKTKSQRILEGVFTFSWATGARVSEAFRERLVSLLQGSYTTDSECTQPGSPLQPCWTSLTSWCTKNT